MKSLVQLFALITLLAGATALSAQTEASLTDHILKPTAPVVIDGDELFRLRGISSYPAEERARNVRGRIISVARDRTFDPGDLVAQEQELVTWIKAGEQEIMAVTDADAAFEGIDRALLAAQFRRAIEAAIIEFREDRSSERLTRNGLFAVVASAIFALAFWGVLRLHALAHDWSARRTQRSLAELASRSYNLFHAGQLWRLLSGGLNLLRLVLLLALVYFYLNVVLGLFPWTRPIAVSLFNLVLTPLQAIGTGFLAALPDLAFLVVLVFVVRYALKLIRAFFNGVHHGRIRFENFDPDWALPTFRIVRVLVIAFSLVIAYPYIPGSDSLAFKGVSVFVGVLLSLGSSSFIANAIAGMTMTYRGAFKEGDLVRVGDVTGRVEDIRLMVTRVRTPKNEAVILPNSNILNTDVINYTALAREDGLVLHTEVGIGYDTPWRQVEAMLLEAAARTEGVEAEPPPFVLQRALGDFAVTYELNALCRDERKMPKRYSDLHANIQDVFNEHGVQIMSPHYVGDTDPPKVVAPEDWYAAPATKPG